MKNKKFSKVECYACNKKRIYANKSLKKEMKTSFRYNNFKIIGHVNYLGLLCHK